MLKYSFQVIQTVVLQSQRNLVSKHSCIFKSLEISYLNANVYTKMTSRLEYMGVFDGQLVGFIFKYTGL
jgi:hypothetical protein